jgi:hypothetical protein
MGESQSGSCFGEHTDQIIAVGGDWSRGLVRSCLCVEWCLSEGELGEDEEVDGF